MAELKKVCLMSAIVAIVLSCLVALIALEHNPQQEFTNSIAHLMELVGSWFLVAFMASIPVIWLTILIIKKLKSGV